MPADILQSFALGFVITAIPGPAVLEAARRALAHRSVLHYLAGNFVGVGATILVAFLGLSQLLRSATWSHVFYLLSGMTLLYIGVTSLASRKQHQKAHAARPAYFRLRPSGRAFLAGLIIAAANPVSILFWVTMMGQFFGNHDSTFLVTANCIAILLGGAVFYALLLAATHMTHRVMSQKYLAVLTDFFGVIILIYGGFVVSRVF